MRAELSDAEIVEIVLDLVRNAANKIAVSLGGDEAVVTDGVEYYDVDATGDVVRRRRPRDRARRDHRPDHLRLTASARAPRARIPT